MTKKYNTAELIGILKLIGETFITDWNMVMKIVKCWDSVRVIEKSWADSFRNDNMDMYHIYSFIICKILINYIKIDYKLLI